MFNRNPLPDHAITINNLETPRHYKGFFAKKHNTWDKVGKALLSTSLACFFTALAADTADKRNAITTFLLLSVILTGLMGGAMQCVSNDELNTETTNFDYTVGNKPRSQ